MGASAKQVLGQLKRRTEEDSKYIWWSFGFFISCVVYIILKRIVSSGWQGRRLISLCGLVQLFGASYLGRTKPFVISWVSPTSSRRESIGVHHDFVSIVQKRVAMVESINF